MILLLWIVFTEPEVDVVEVDWVCALAGALQISSVNSLMKKSILFGAALAAMGLAIAPA